MQGELDVAVSSVTRLVSWEPSKPEMAILRVTTADGRRWIMKTATQRMFRSIRAEAAIYARLSASQCPCIVNSLGLVELETETPVAADETCRGVWKGLVTEEFGQDLHTYTFWWRYHAQKCAKPLIAQLLFAVIQFHIRGIVHADLKPTNLLVERAEPKDEDATLHLRVCDFGHAKRIGELVTYQTGTPRYKPPEFEYYGTTDFPCGSVRYAPTCDAWGIGVIAYGLISGMQFVRGDLLEDYLDREERFRQFPEWEAFLFDSVRFTYANRLSPIQLWMKHQKLLNIPDCVHSAVAKDAEGLFLQIPALPTLVLPIIQEFERDVQEQETQQSGRRPVTTDMQESDRPSN